jgi:hypothetical protein
VRDAKQGETFAVRIDIQRTGEYKSPITFSLTAPAGIKISAPNLIVPPEAPGGSLNVFVDPSVAVADEIKLTLKGVGDRRQKTKTLTLRVLEANFEPLLDPPLIEAQQGQVLFVEVGMRRIGSFDQPVKVSIFPNNLGISGDQAIIGAGQAKATLTLFIGPNTPLGEQTLKLNYSGGAREKTAELKLKVIESEF